MSSRDQLEQYLQRARARLKLVLLSQGAALLAGLLLVVTLLAALWISRAVFSDAAAGIGRALLVAALLGAVVFAVLRWRALQRNEGADALERALPAQSGRIHTYLQESRKPGEAPFLLELLADDAARIADAEPLARSIPTKRLAIPAAAAGVAFAALLSLFFIQGTVGDGARHLWMGQLPPASRIAVAAGGIAVRPGDVSVRRNQDLPISALVAGGSRDAQLHVKFGDGDWETAPMVAGKDGGYSFTLFAVRDGARYYVSAGSLKSREHKIDVVDLPRIESLRLTYRYPSWTGLAQQVQEGTGDIRAVAGTQVALEVRTDKPLTSPLIIVNGASAALAQTQSTSAGSLVVKQPGHYRIATRFGDEVVPLTDDYLIDVVPDEKPTVQILRPGRDYRATNVEEVPVGIKAQDDFRLEALELHYSVNGGDWRVEKLPAGSPDIQAAALLRLEEMQQKGPQGQAPLLVPGDLVSYFAQARDHGSSAQTDLFLIQVQPFEQRYTQSQANGGGGGGGGGEEDQNQISQRQREVLLATFNLQRNRAKEGGRAAERDADNARMLSEVQNTIAEQARTLVERAKARELTGDENVNKFVKSLEEATKSMRPASESLDKQDLETAVKHEQQALQHLLRAEATFREIQVSMQRGGGGGGGGGAQAGRDVSEMTELEMDLAKNQYETQSSMSQEQRSQTEDEAMRRLRELARRQEQLAREAARQQTPPEAQKWQQEQLRREAEQLRQQLEQLAQQQRGGQQGAQQQNGRQQGTQQGAQGQASASAAAEAARQVSEAMRQMQARNGSPQENANRASEQLKRAGEQLERGQRQAVGDRFNELSRSARDLADRQKQAGQDLRAALTPQAPPSIARPGQQQRNGLSYEQAERLAQQKRDIQSGLEELQRQMRATRQQAGARAPRASEKVAQATKELEESDTASRLARSASEIERGRGVQAASRDGLINEGLEQLQQSLDEAASVAAGENGERRTAQRDANPGDLLSELSDLRRALERARAQGVAQNGRNQGEAGTRSPEARDGQAGQEGGQSGQQGQGEGRQQGQGGNQPGGQGGRNGGADGGGDDFGRAGGGTDFGGGRGRFVSGGGRLAPLTDADRRALREQGQLSSQRLQQLREQLANGALAEADVTALRELSERLRRGGADPLSAEYPRMATLLDQLELAALKADRASSKETPARANGAVDDSRRYRDNVAEYYRKLGETNDR